MAPTYAVPGLFIFLEKFPQSDSAATAKTFDLLDQQKVLRAVGFFYSILFIVPFIKSSEDQDLTVVKVLKQFNSNSIVEKLLNYSETGMK